MACIGGLSWGKELVSQTQAMPNKYAALKIAPRCSCALEYPAAMLTFTPGSVAWYRGVFHHKGTCS